MIFRNFPLNFVPTQSWLTPAGNPHGPGLYFGARRPSGAGTPAATSSRR